MSVVVRASVIVTAPTDEQCDKVLRDLVGHRDELAEVYVSVVETSRKLES